MLNQDFLAVKLIQRLSMHWSLAVGSDLVGLNLELRVLMYIQSGVKYVEF